MVESLLHLHKALGSVPKAKSKIVCTVTYIPSGSDVAANLFSNTKGFWMLEIIHLSIFKMLCLIEKLVNTSYAVPTFSDIWNYRR